MKLWSDYEGRTIAEAYPLKKLVRPEGRSAFFLTTNGTGTPALVRVIEAHFDESEILERWKSVSEINQENLITMRKFGETELDGTPLVYAVMEPTEISLEELLENRTLTVDETRQLAHSLVGAIQALHARNMVHEHIEPVNILAAGELVKLRSDCVREAVDHVDNTGPTVAELKSADAHALAIVLLQALTGRRSLQGSATLLPSPFDGIIRNGLSGRWSLTEMAAALGPVAPAQVAAATTPRPAAQTTAPAPVQAAVKPATPVTPAVKPAETATVAPKAETLDGQAISTPAPPTQESLFARATPVVTPAAKPVTPAATPSSSTSAKAVAESLSSAAASAIKKPLTPAQAPDVRHRIVRPVEADPKRARMWIAAAAAVLLLLIVGWRLMRTGPSTTANSATKPISTLADPDPVDKTAATAAAAPSAKPSANRFSNGRSAAVKPAPAGPAPNASAATAASTAGRTQWRVVAYTYNRQEQAQQKADSLAKQHPSLNPQVFSPSGRAPFLVTVGGPMSRDQAEAFKQKARNEGLPHDIYAQNYSR